MCEFHYTFTAKQESQTPKQEGGKKEAKTAAKNKLHV